MQCSARSHQYFTCLHTVGLLTGTKLTPCRAYRKRLVTGLPSLNYLDEMPVDQRERRLAAAFMEGGQQVAAQQHCLMT